MIIHLNIWAYELTANEKCYTRESHRERDALLTVGRIAYVDQAHKLLVLQEHALD